MINLFVGLIGIMFLLGFVVTIFGWVISFIYDNFF